MESQPKNPEIRINPENFHPYTKDLLVGWHSWVCFIHGSKFVSYFIEHHKQGVSMRFQLVYLTHIHISVYKVVNQGWLHVCFCN